MTQQDELVLPIFNEGGHFRLLYTILQDLAPELLNYPLLLQLMQHFVFQHIQQVSLEKQIFTLEELEQEIVSKMDRTSKENLEFLSTTLLGMQMTVDTYQLFSVSDLEHFLLQQQARIRDNITDKGTRSFSNKGKNHAPNDNHRKKNKS